MSAPRPAIEHGRPPPRFTALWPDAGGLALFAELAQFVIDLPGAHLLHPAARAELAALDPARLEQLRANLGALAARGFWEANAADAADAADATSYICPDFAAAPRAPAGLDPAGAWRSLADPCEDPLIARLADALALPPATTAIVVDDWLDPRLEALDCALRAAGRPWLLVRLAGDHPTVGPLFGAAGAACWSCLAFRLLWNQPVRRWYHRAHPGPLAPIPAAWRPRAVEVGLPRLAAAARRILESRAGDALIEVAWASRDERRHPVVGRPQCPRCGDPTRYEQRARAPVSLAPAPRVAGEDGGVRIQPVEATSRLLDAIISPLTGLVAGVVCQSRPGPDINQVFRAWFGKTTYHAGLPRTEQLFQTTMGKGISAAQSRVSAIAESLERLAASYHGDEPIVRARATELPGRSFPPAALAPYSEAQYRAFEAAAERRPAAPVPIHAMLPAPPDAVLEWTPVWSLTRAETCFVPFTWCYTNTPYDADLRCRFFHNGGAAGACLEEAILQGFLELVERDAVATWWYNRARRPAVDTSSLPEALARQLAATVGVDSDYWVLDVTHDFGIPVCVAVSQHRATGKLCLGMGCHLDPRLALRRALTELCQILEIRYQHAAPFDFDAIPAAPFLFPDPDQPPAAQLALPAAPSPTSSDLADDVRACVARARALGLEVLILDYSRPDFPLRTAKVIMPGTCHLFPYRGAARLYEVPVRMGWRSAPLTEAELNPLELLI